MSYWGVWRSYTSDELHVVPCDEDGNVIAHVCTTECWCKPVPDGEVPDMFVHNDPERGGYNA